MRVKPLWFCFVLLILFCLFHLWNGLQTLFLESTLAFLAFKNPSWVLWVLIIYFKKSTEN